MTYRERKEFRKEYYLKFVCGWKQIKCVACNGSGVYDHDGSPSCECCEGTGKERVPPKEFQEEVSRKQI